MIAAAYVRKSTDEGDRNADVKSVAVQRSVIEAFAAQRGLTLDERYIFTDDGISGAEFKNRPGLQALLAALEPVPPFQALIVTEQSRLGRETLDTLLVVRQVEEAGVAIWSATEGRKITMADDTGEIMSMLSSWRDTSERRKTVTRVRNAAFERHDNGYVPGGKTYGYRQNRPGPKQPVTRVVHEQEAGVVRRIFSLTVEGFGLAGIAKKLTAEGVPGPEYGCGKITKDGHVHGDACPRQPWSISGVREVLHRPDYRGEIVLGRVRRGRIKGKKVRIQVPEAEWKRRQDESLRIVSDELWTAAHAQVEKSRATFLRKTNGRLLGQAERTKGLFLLSNLLVCSARVPEGAMRAHGGYLCGEPLIAVQRGRNLRRVYICRGHREKGDVYCTNSTGVPMDEIHRGVVRSLRETFTAESFEAHLKKTAENEEARASRQAERDTLLARIPVLSAECERLADAVAAGNGTMDVLLNAIKTRQAEREQAEARVTEIEGAERDLRADGEAVERLRSTWGSWSGALEQDLVMAR